MINPFTPVATGGGYYQMKRKEPTPAERNEFITQAMRVVVNDEELILTANPDRIPAKVFQHIDANKFKGTGKWYMWLDIETQRVHIGLRYKDYKIQGRTENQVYMAIRVDLEKIIDVFDNLEFKK
jgi:hypothetical protein